MVTQKEEAIFKGQGAGSHTLGRWKLHATRCWACRLATYPSAMEISPASKFSSCRSEVEHATPVTWRLSAPVASDKVTINSPTCKKIIWQRIPKCPPLPYKPANKWYRNEVRKESRLPGPWIHLPTSEPIQGKGWELGTRALGGQVEFGGRATLQDLTGSFCQPSASLCLSHNRETQTGAAHACGYTLTERTLANANSIVASCHPGTQKKDVDFHMNQNTPLYTSWWPTCSICTSKAQPITGHTAGELHRSGRLRAQRTRSKCPVPLLQRQNPELLKWMGPQF